MRALGLLLVLLWLPSQAWASDGLSVYVFAPTGGRTHELEKMLKKELPGIEVTVFGRSADFRNALATAPPGAVIAPRPVLEELALKPELQGLVGTEDSEAWVLMSTEPGLTREALGTKTVGMVDLLGHKKMGAFASVLLGVKSPPKVQSVTKTEDLLPLLQFKSADVVLVPESALEGLKSRSRMALQILKLEGSRVGRVAIAFPQTTQRTKLEASLTALPKEATEMIGIASWRRN